jgi:hypothetical protein
MRRAICIILSTPSRASKTVVLSVPASRNTPHDTSADHGPVAPDAATTNTERAGRTDVPWPAGSVDAYARIDNDTPSFAAITEVAPGVRFSDFDIFLTPALAFAIDFIWRTSSLVHSRRTIFLALAILTPVLVKRPCITRHHDGNGMTRWRVYN